MHKRLLEKSTASYDNLPAWLAVLVLSGLVLGFEFVGGLIGGVFISFGFLLSLFRLGLSGLQDRAMTFFNSLYFELALFLFIALALLFWVKVVEKRSILSLGFFKGHVLIDILKGWGMGTLLLLASLAGTYVLGGVSSLTVDLSWMSFVYVISLIPFWFLQGGTEELVMRGWLLPLLSQKMRLSLAVILSSVIFALLHLSNPHVTILSITSLILTGIFLILLFSSILRLLCGCSSVCCLICRFLAHALHNLVNIIKHRLCRFGHTV